MLALKSMKKPETPARKGVSPLTKEPCVFKSKAARQVEEGQTRHGDCNVQMESMRGDVHCRRGVGNQAPGELRWAVSGVGRTPEERSHSRNDQAAE